MSAPVYLEYSGEHWRVHDLAFGPPHASPGRWRRTRLGSALANYRAFVNASGEQWWYQYRPGDDRSTEPDVLAAQRRAAWYHSRERYDPSERTPR